MRHLTIVVALSTMAVTGCAFGPTQAERTDATLDVVVAVVSERGEPMVDARFDAADRSFDADFNGRFTVPVASPIAGVVVAPGKLPEPLVLSPRDRSVEVVVLDRDGAAGRRTVLHFGGDVMLGRRYQSPGREGTPTVDSDRSARSVVSDLAPLAAAADATVVNLETVVGDLPSETAYPGKRFLLQSPPNVLAALDELGVDAVTLGNNHANDWRDEGVASTIATLDRSGVPHAGAGLTESDAHRGLLLETGSGRVGIISATTVNGDFVNDSLPVGTDGVPVSLPVAEAWQYERRPFEFGQPGEPAYFPDTERVAGDAWREYESMEDGLSPEHAAEVWRALTAPGAFPELQDWVARRGHGGAAAYDRQQIASEIARLRADGADVVVVQFHSGYQFAESPSTFLRRISHAAIDDGADLVVGHHPHVLQGLEWYRGRLIAYSLGNLVFDQDFLATFPSVMLRVVVDPAGLVDARVLPIMLVDYRPVPVAGAVAERIVRLIDVRSALPAESERLRDFQVGSVIVDAASHGSERVTVTIDRNTGEIGSERDVTTLRVHPSVHLSARVPTCLAVRADNVPSTAQYGVDLFGWGSFDDGTADGERRRPMHWIVPPAIDDWDLVQGASPDPTDDALRLNTDANRAVATRFVARVPIAAHRLFGVDGEPIDAPPEYTIELDAARVRGELASIRLDVYHVMDEDPTSDPESELLRTVELPLEIEEGAGWRRVVIDVPDSAMAPVDGRSADAVMLSIRVAPAFRGSYVVDNIRFMEWRGAPSSSVPLWSEIDALRGSADAPYAVIASGCGSV